MVDFSVEFELGLEASEQLKNMVAEK